MYHLVGKGLKLPFWDRVPKNRFLKMPFEKKLNRGLDEARRVATRDNNHNALSLRVGAAVIPQTFH